MELSGDNLRRGKWWSIKRDRFLKNDGCPGMRTIVDILLGSKRSYEGRRVFMMTQLLFWMLAAIDGHAKKKIVCSTCEEGVSYDSSLR